MGYVILNNLSNELFVILINFSFRIPKSIVQRLFRSTTEILKHARIFKAYCCLKVDNKIFHSFHKSDRSDISTNAVDNLLCVNIILS